MYLWSVYNKNITLYVLLMRYLKRGYNAELTSMTFNFDFYNMKSNLMPV